MPVPVLVSTVCMYVCMCVTNIVWVHEQLIPTCRCCTEQDARQPTVLTHLGMVSSGVLGHSALLFHQEAEPPALLSECCLVAVRHVVLQLALLIADGINVLGAGNRGDRSARRWQILLGFRQHIQSSLQASLGVPAHTAQDLVSPGGLRWKDLWAYKHAL